MTGRIVKALSGFYYVDCDGEIIQCKPRGKFRYEKVSPLVTLDKKLKKLIEKLNE